MEFYLFEIGSLFVKLFNIRYRNLRTSVVKMKIDF